LILCQELHLSAAEPPIVNYSWSQLPLTSSRGKKGIFHVFIEKDTSEKSNFLCRKGTLVSRPKWPKQNNSHYVNHPTLKKNIIVNIFQASNCADIDFTE